MASSDKMLMLKGNYSNRPVKVFHRLPSMGMAVQGSQHAVLIEVQAFIHLPSYMQSTAFTPGLEVQGIS